MQLPFRPKQQMKQLLQAEEPFYLTQDAIEQLTARLERIEHQELPQAIEDVRRTGEFGDFSENAEYQEAKGRMRHLHDQVASIKHKLKTAIVIERGQGESTVQLGSYVTLRTPQGEEKRFSIVGPHEADPTKGRLSFKSPLGAKLMGRCVGEQIQLTTAGGEALYQILTIG